MKLEQQMEMEWKAGLLILQGGFVLPWEGWEASCSWGCSVWD